MTRLIAVLLVGAAVASYASASLTAPEIDVNTGMGALTLLSGAAMVIRARIRK